MPDRHPLPRLREAREGRAMSLDDLEAKSGISRSMLYAYEQGAHQPRPEALARLSLALNVRPNFLSMNVPEPEPAPIFMRHFRSKASAKQLLAVQRQMPWVRDVVRFIEERAELPSVNLPDFYPPSDPRDITAEQIEQAATAIRRHWGLGDGVIRDVIKLVENNGCIVVPELIDCEAIDAFSQWSTFGRPFIVMNSHQITGVRWRVDAAHELGHLVLHRMVDRRFIEANPWTHKLIEKQAFRFAGAFLMPEATFRKSLACITLDNLLVAKAHWFLSVGVQLQRAEDIGMIDNEAAKKLWANRNRRGWRMKEPLDDTLPVEQPKMLANAIQALLEDDPQHIVELCTTIGFEEADVTRFCGTGESALSRDRQELHPRVRGKRDLKIM